MDKDRTFLIAEGLLSGELDMIGGVIYYGGKMLCDRFREILMMNVRMCMKLSKSLVNMLEKKESDVLKESEVLKEIEELTESEELKEIEEVKEYKNPLEEGVVLEKVRKTVLDRRNFDGIIYELSNDVDDRVYIGSTSNLNMRLKCHMLCAYLYDNWKIRYCSSYEILKYKKVKVRVIKKGMYKDNMSMLEDESCEINRYKACCTNVVDPVSHENVSVEVKNSRKQRKLLRVEYLYGIGVGMLKDVMLSDDDLVMLKYNLIKKCEEDIKVKKSSIKLEEIYDIKVIE
jgi:hypothetical protein